MAKSKAKMKKGITAVGYAPVNFGEENSSITYGNIKYLLSNVAGGREYSAEPRGDSQKIYADSVAIYGDVVNDGYDINLTLLSAFDEGVNADWLNEKKDEKGTAEYADGEEFPYFALIIHEDTSDGVGQITIYYYCQVSGRPSDSGKTGEGSTFDYDFPEYPIVASPRPTDMLVRYRISGKEKLSAIPEPTALETTSAEENGKPVTAAPASTAAKSSSK